MDPAIDPLDRLTRSLIGAAIEVHRELGPGLLESAYDECLCFELSQLGVSFRRQVELPVLYKGLKLDCGYRLDILVEDSVVLEIKAVERLLPVHSAQLLTYLKLSCKQVGLLLNFNEPVLTKGLKRLVNHFGGAANPISPPRRRDAEEDTHPQSSRFSPRLGVSAVKS